MAKPKVPKVNFKSRTMLPKYSDEELTLLAARMLKTIDHMANATYQAIGAARAKGADEALDLFADALLAAYRKGLERAARLCSSRAEECDGETDFYRGARNNLGAVAEAIRAEAEAAR